MLIRKLWPALIWALIILILTGFPGDYFPEIIDFWEWIGPDKLVHLAIFGILTFLIFFNLRAEYLVSKKRSLFVLTILGVTLAYGLLTEVLQATVFVGRDGNVFDFYANSTGALLGWLVFSLVIRKKIKI